MIGKAKDSRTDLRIFIFSGLVIIAYRLIVLYHFGFIYTDSDQSIMWLGAKHFSQGLFYEPRFYGQAYNTMMEAFLAVPLIKMGVPLYKALPAITTLLSLLPVFLLSIITYLRNSKNTGILVLCIYLALPLEYSLITTLSRGFITGIAFASLAFLFLYRFESKTAYFFVFLISMLAYSINANSIILSIPICMIFFLKNYKNKHFYIFSGVGILLALAIHLMVASFYVAHPYYNLHKYHFEFSFDYLIRGTLDLNKFFNYNTPVFWNHGWLLLVMFLIPAAIYYKKKKFDFLLFHW